MSYYLYLVETKKEYTIHLINALTPLMYEGISSIYDDAKKSSPNSELITFQNLLKKIPSWNEHIIKSETERIIRSSVKGEFIEDLIRAVIKANIMILTNTPPEKKDNLKIKHEITTEKFIHHSYIEIARNIFQNPYLFYHKHNSFELKKNQRESLEIIKNSLEQSIRKMLPMNIILQNYLGTSFVESKSDDFHNAIPDSDYNNLRHMLNKEKTDNTYQLVKDDYISNKLGLSNDDITNLEKINKPIINIEKTNNDTINIKLNSNVKQNVQSTDNFKKFKELGLQAKTAPNKIPDFRDTENNRDMSRHKIPTFKKIDLKDNNDSEEESVSYYKQVKDKQDYAEVYDNSKYKAENFKRSETPKRQSIKIQNKIMNNVGDNASIQQKNLDKPFINYNDILNNDSSINLKSIMNDISTVKNNSNQENKNKYFEKNNNL